MGPPLAAAIAALAAAVGLAIARHVATRGRTVLEDRIAWLVCAPMILSGLVFVVVALTLLPTVPFAGLLLLLWGVLELGVMAFTLARLPRSTGDPRTPHPAGRGTGGPLGNHLMAAFGFLVAGTMVAAAGLVIWAASQRG